MLATRQQSCSDRGKSERTTIVAPVADATSSDTARLRLCLCQYNLQPHVVACNLCPRPGQCTAAKWLAMRAEGLKSALCIGCRVAAVLCRCCGCRNSCNAALWASNPAPTRADVRQCMRQSAHAQERAHAPAAVRHHVECWHCSRHQRRRRRGRPGNSGGGAPNARRIEMWRVILAHKHPPGRPLPPAHPDLRPAALSDAAAPIAALYQLQRPLQVV